MKKHPIDATHVDAKRTIQALTERKVIGQEKNVYDLVEDYYQYLQNNAITLARSKFQDTLNNKLISQLTNLRKVADILTNYAILASICPPGWSPIHEGYPRVMIGKKWINDYKDDIATRFKENKLMGITHSLCDECRDYVRASIQ